jgi:hypothetical protein
MGSKVAPWRLTGVHEQRAAHHQGLLVGQQQTLAGPGGRQTGRQTGRSDNRPHDGIHIRMRRNHFKSIPL